MMNNMVLNCMVVSDNESCVTTGWYHFDCLCESKRKVIRDSLDDDDVQWNCKAFFPGLYEKEYMINVKQPPI
jgi:hypothetical protein